MITQFRLNLFEEDRFSRRADETESAIRTRAAVEVKNPKERKAWLEGMDSAMNISRRIVGNNGDPWKNGYQRLASQAISAVPLYTQGILSPWQMLLPVSGLASDRGKLGFLDAQLRAIDSLERSSPCQEDSDLAEALQEEKAILNESRQFTNIQANVRIAGIALSAFAIGSYFSWCALNNEKFDMVLLAQGATFIGGATNAANLILHMWTGSHQSQEHEVRARNIMARLAAGLGASPSSLEGK